jgi:hypothetical protein
LNQVYSPIYKMSERDADDMIEGFVLIPESALLIDPDAPRPAKNPEQCTNFMLGALEIAGVILGGAGRACEIASDALGTVGSALTNASDIVNTIRGDIIQNRMIRDGSREALKSPHQFTTRETINYQL